MGSPLTVEAALTGVGGAFSTILGLAPWSSQAATGVQPIGGSPV
jgi:hypothetical protein